MKIRRYLGNNTQEAILKVKMDLGNNAVILNTRKVRKKGFLKMFAKPMVEVLAAVDEYYGSKKETGLTKHEEKNYDAKENQEKTKPDEKEKKISELENKLSSIEGLLQNISELENKVSGMETLLQKIYEQLQIRAQKVDIIKQEEKQQTSSDILQLYYNNLIKNEVELEIARRIINMVSEKIGNNANGNNLASVLYNLIAGILGKPQTIRLKEDGGPTVIIFVGPTGVGKTTTLAKIAASFVLNHKRGVGLIAADTYRIAAVEQLKTYAEILRVPMSVIYSANEIKDAINLYSDKDVILIDTAGRSYKNRPQFEELETLVNESGADEVYLVLSSTTSIRNCKEILSNYSFLKDYKLIFTKLDETPITGIILNARYLTNKNLSYITTGQNVPHDIDVANVDKITKNLLGSLN